MKRKADKTMADNKRKATKNEKMSMKENERLLRHDRFWKD